MATFRIRCNTLLEQKWCKSGKICHFSQSELPWSSDAAIAPATFRIRCNTWLEQKWCKSGKLCHFAQPEHVHHLVGAEVAKFMRGLDHSSVIRVNKLKPLCELVVKTLRGSIGAFVFSVTFSSLCKYSFCICAVLRCAIQYTPVPKGQNELVSLPYC